MPILNRTKKITNSTHPAPARAPIRKSASEFKVPPRGELIPELAKLDEKTVEISEITRNARAEIPLLTKEIAADDSPELRPDVAALLSAEPSPKAAKRKRIKELRHTIAVADAAMVEIAKRRVALETEAGRAVTAACRPEAERLVGNLVKALQAADVAHRELGDLLLAIEAEGASTGGLGPVQAFFLNDGKVANYIRDVKGAGYNV